MITLRLSNERDHAIEFSAWDAGSLQRGCQDAWSRYRAQVARTPGLFEAHQSVNRLRHKLQDDLSGANRDRKLADWQSRGHAREEAERLWQQLLHTRQMQMANAERTELRSFTPSPLALHLRSPAARPGDWLMITPGEPRGVLFVGGELRVLGQPAHWGDLWRRIICLHEHSQCLEALCRWLVEPTRDNDTVARRPHLYLVADND